MMASLSGKAACGLVEKDRRLGRFGMARARFRCRVRKTIRQEKKTAFGVVEWTRPMWKRMAYSFAGPHGFPLSGWISSVGRVGAA